MKTPLGTLICHTSVMSGGRGLLGDFLSPGTCRNIIKLPATDVTLLDQAQGDLIFWYLKAWTCLYKHEKGTHAKSELAKADLTSIQKITFARCVSSPTGKLPLQKGTWTLPLKANQRVSLWQFMVTFQREHAGGLLAEKCPPKCSNRVFLEWKKQCLHYMVDSKN